MKITRNCPTCSAYSTRSRKNLITIFLLLPPSSSCFSLWNDCLELVTESLLKKIRRFNATLNLKRFFAYHFRISRHRRQKEKKEYLRRNRERLSETYVALLFKLLFNRRSHRDSWSDWLRIQMIFGRISIERLWLFTDVLVNWFEWEGQWFLMICWNINNFMLRQNDSCKDSQEQVLLQANTFRQRLGWIHHKLTRVPAPFIRL